ncbi:putative RING-H2 finger protein ATL21A [Bidens hawaiensis]|uniref:putative RING-H2 finger protein ATL21A n=1 Tax=Bidens hawaiensis TaxID=980011 RepID=UPI004048EEAD
MAACNFFMSIFFIFTFIQLLDGKFTSNICNHDKPHVQFPFKVNSFCKHNQTMIKFKGYGELGVKSISNEPKKLTLFDPKDCVFEVFLNLDLDITPFRYYHLVMNYTYWNCLIGRSGSLEPVPCLSDNKHHVYVVESSLDVPGSCEAVKTVLIPFSYSSYVSDDSFGLDLTWDSAGVMDFAEEKRGFGVESVVGGISMVIMVLVILGLGCIKVYLWKKLRTNEHEWEKLIGDLETL